MTRLLSSTYDSAGPRTRVARIAGRMRAWVGGPPGWLTPQPLGTGPTRMRPGGAEQCAGSSGRQPMQRPEHHCPAPPSSPSSVCSYLSSSVLSLRSSTLTCGATRQAAGVGARPRTASRRPCSRARPPALGQPTACLAPLAVQPARSGQQLAHLVFVAHHATAWGHAPQPAGHALRDVDAARAGRGRGPAARLGSTSKEIAWRGRACSRAGAMLSSTHPSCKHAQACCRRRSRLPRKCMNRR